MRRTKQPPTASNGLTTKQLKLVEEMAKGTKVVEIARKLGLARSSIYNELNKPVVKQAIREMQWLMNQQNFRRVQEIASKALKTLDRLLDSNNEAARLKASEVALKANSGQTTTQPPEAHLPTFDLKGEDLTVEKIVELQAQLMTQVVEGKLDEKSFWRAWNIYAYIRSKLESIDSLSPLKKFGHFSHGSEK